MTITFCQYSLLHYMLLLHVCGLLAMYYYKAEKTVLSVFENCTLQLIRVDLQAIVWKVKNRDLCEIYFLS